MPLAYRRTRGKSYTTCEDEFIELNIETMTAAEIGRHIGRTEKSVSERALRIGCGARDSRTIPRSKYGVHECNIAFQLVQDGMSIRLAAEKLDINYHVLRYNIKKRSEVNMQQVVRDYKYLAGIAAQHEKQCRYKQAEAIWIEAKEKAKTTKNQQWAEARATHCAKLKNTIEPKFGFVMCRLCNSQHVAESNAAKFIGAKGYCLACV